MDHDTLARILLFALQVFTVITALVLSADPSSWFSWVPGAIGIAVCNDDVTCYTKQMVYRTEAAGFLVFMVLVILSVSGCAPKAHWWTCPGVFTVLLVPFVFVFFPNSIFEGFATVAVVISAVFLVLQTLVLVDFAQEINDTIFDVGISARRISINSDYVGAAKIVLIVFSVLLLGAALTGTIILSIGFTNGWVVAIAFVVSLALLVVSITEWCEHGSLFASSLVTSYSVWLSYEVLITLQAEYTRPPFAKWLGLGIAMATLAASVFGSALGLGGVAGQEPMLGEGDGSGVNATSFAIQSGLHALATLYIATALAAPPESTVGFVFRVIALVGSLLLYGWTLIAPKVLPGRF